MLLTKSPSYPLTYPVEYEMIGVRRCDMNNLESRIETLERKARMYRVLLILTLLPILGLTFSAATDGIPELIQAKGFWLIDDKGEAVATLGTSANGEPMLIIGTSGNPRIVATSDTDNAHIAAFDKDAKVRSLVSADGTMTLISKSGISFRYPFQLKGDF